MSVGSRLGRAGSPRLHSGHRAWLIALALAVSATGAHAGEAFSPQAWAEDLDQLREAMSTRYPNLEWQAERGLDLKLGYARTRDALLAARDESQARAAFERLIRALADGHVQVRWPSAAAVADPARAARPVQAPLCQRLGFRPQADNRAIATRLPGFKPVGATDAHLRAGVVTVDGRRLGVLRVPLFSPQAFPDICARVIEEAGLKSDSPCDDECQNRLSRKADMAFGREMRAQLGALAAARPDALLIDVAGNGGGDDSSHLLARLLTDRPLRRPVGAFIRGSATAELFEGRRNAARDARATAKGATADGLRRYEAALDKAILEARAGCDRSPLWRGEPIACTALVREPVYEGPLPSASEDPPEWVLDASPVTRYGGAQAVWRGPVIVLVDGESASSTELFAAMLQDAGAAQVVGAGTAGAGCGRVTAMGPVELAQSHGVVSMPDCVRYRRDGANELDGIEPDLAIGFRAYDTPNQRIERLSRVLPKALSAARKARPRPGT